MCDQQLDQPVHTRNLIRTFASRLHILGVLLTEHHLEFLSLKGGYIGNIGSSESTLVEMPHCWKSHVVAHFML